MASKRTNRLDDAVTISMASRITGVELHTLRYWEREFADVLNPVRTGGGQRRYRPEDIQIVFAIKRLLRDEMFSIAGARRHLHPPMQNQAVLNVNGISRTEPSQNERAA